MRRPSGIDEPSPTLWPRKVLAMAGLFALICFGLQAWRLFSLSATYDQALFLQELWATAQGRPFESSLSSVLSGAVVVGDGLEQMGLPRREALREEEDRGAEIGEHRR